jgi:riboflavin transporter FmnP
LLFYNTAEEAVSFFVKNLTNGEVKPMKRKFSTQQLTMLAMFIALGYMFMLVTRLSITFVPSLPFLKYDPKDVIIVMAGFIYGPLSAFIVTVLVAVLEFFTVSETGIIGLIMNVLATASFTCTAAIIYQKMRSRKGALIGLISASIVLTIVMVLWNIIVTPMYMGIPREAIIAMIIPGFIPFNLLKGLLNASFAFLLYKPLVSALRRMKVLAPHSSSSPEGESGLKASTVMLSLGAVSVCIVVILLLNRG